MLSQTGGRKGGCQATPIFGTKNTSAISTKAQHSTLTVSLILCSSGSKAQGQSWELLEIFPEVFFYIAAQNRQFLCLPYLMPYFPISKICMRNSWWNDEKSADIVIKSICPWVLADYHYYLIGDILIYGDRKFSFLTQWTLKAYFHIFIKALYSVLSTSKVIGI